MSFFGKIFGKKEKESLDSGLQKTKEGFLSKITKAIAGKSVVDEEVLDNLQQIRNKLKGDFANKVQQLNELTKVLISENKQPQ